MTTSDDAGSDVDVKRGPIIRVDEVPGEIDAYMLIMAMPPEDGRMSAVKLTGEEALAVARLLINAVDHDRLF